MDIMVNPTITKFAQKVDGEITELKLGAKQEDAYAQIYAKGAESGSAKLENNKTATINVSTYTEPVEITPTSGKDGMKKATITLSNIPSPSGTEYLYAWKNTVEETSTYRYTSSATPISDDTVFLATDGKVELDLLHPISEVGDNTITVNSVVYTRSSEDDIHLF